MSVAMTQSVRRELQAPNVGFRLLFDNSQARTSAFIFLQWCVAKEFADFLVEQGVRRPMVFVQVFDSRGREQRYLYDFNSTQEMLQFHSSGMHNIQATVVWGAREATVRGRLLESRAMGYRYTLNECLGEANYSGPKSKRTRRDGIGLKRFGVAKLSLEVPAEFFAPKLSDWEDWWVNFWFDRRAWDSCSIRRRRAVAYLIQPFVLGPYVLGKMLFRLVCASFFFFLCALRVDWGVIVHPFFRGIRDIVEDEPYGTSWLARNVDGSMRKFGEASFLFIPLLQFFLVGVSAWWAFGGLGWSFSLLHWAEAYVLTIVALVLFVTIVVTSDEWVLKVKKFFAWLVPERQSRFEWLTCNRVPERGLRSTGYTPRLLYQKTKARFCKPAAA